MYSRPLYKSFGSKYGIAPSSVFDGGKARLSRPTFTNLVWWFDWTDINLVSNSSTSLVPAANGEEVKRTYMVQNTSFAMTGTASRYATYRHIMGGKSAYAEFNGSTQHSVRVPTEQVDPPYTVCIAFDNFLAGTGAGTPTIFASNGIVFRRSAVANADYQMVSSVAATANSSAYRAGKVSAILYYNLGSSYMRINGTEYGITLSTNRSFITSTNVVYCATGTDVNNARIDMYSFMVARGELSSTEKTNWENWSSQQLGGLA